MTTTSMDDVFVLPASFAQQRLWFIDQVDPGRPTYNVPVNLRLTGTLDVAALERAFTYLVERHETLRTVFDAPDGQPAQVILPPPAITIPIVDLRALGTDERASEVARLLGVEGNAPFDLRNGPVLRATLLRTADDEHVLLVTIHHIAMDGWSMGVFQRELSAAYTSALAGADPVLPELAIQYADFATWQRDRLDDGGLDEQERYWTTRLAAPLPVLEMPTDRPYLPGRARNAETVAFELPVDVGEAVGTLARDAGTTPFAVLLAAFHTFLHRYSGQDDIIVGSPVAGRTQRETEALIGLFVNTLAMRVDLGGAPTFRGLLDRVRETVHGALAHQDVPFERLVELVQPDRDRARNPVFQALFSLQDFGQGTGMTLPGLTVARMSGSRATAKFDLQLIMAQRGGLFRGTLEYDASLFDEATAHRMMRHFVQLLGSIARTPDVSIEALSMLDADERAQVLTGWNATAREIAGDDDLIALVDAQTARTPNAIALRFGDESLTYAALDARVRRLAAYLVGTGVGPEVPVGLSVERSLETVVSLLAVHRAGAGFLPLDPQNPRDRLEFTLADAGAPVIVTQEALRDRIPLPPGRDVRVVSLDGDAAAIAATPPDGDERSAERRDPDRLAYFMYTSGSTGRPKGVAVTHRNVVNTITGFGDRLPFGPSCVHVAITPLSFDISVLEIFLALSTGACVVIASRETALDPVALGTLIETSGATHFQATPVTWRMLVEGGWRGKLGLIGIAGGEALTPALASALVARGVDLWNCYGPTEITIYATMYRLTSADLSGSAADLAADGASGGSLPIGWPMANVQTYILDRAGNPAPIGVPGELFIGGAGVTRGYHDRAELTAERFVADPFSGRPGARLYRSGDRTRWRSDGAIDYLGRVDDQVKIRGYRIELGEIEASLLTHPAVGGAAAIVRGSENDRRLVGYYVVRAGQSLSPAEMRAHLRERLPEYMVPSALVPMDALPVGATGKVDRKALPDPEAVLGADATTHVPARTTLEHQLVTIWQRLLGKQPIGIREDFFEIGGHSLLAVQMFADIERVSGRRVPLATLFQGATIESLAARVEAAVHDEAEPPVIVLQADGTRTPFVMLHGDVRGAGWYCRRLAPLLGADVPLVVLPTLRPTEESSPETVEAMAAHHVRTLRGVQPHGPYRLGGYCAGGTIAFEMARQLSAAGETVDALVLIDTTAGNARFRRWRPIIGALAGGGSQARRLERSAELLRKLRYYSGRLRAVRRQTAGERTRWLVENVRRRLAPKTLATTAPIAPASAATVSLVARDGEFDVRPATQLLLFQGRAAGAYIPPTYPGVIDLIVAADPTGGVSSELAIGMGADASAPEMRMGRRGWERVAETVRVHPIAASHVGLITDSLPALAQHIRDTLDGVDTKA